MARVVDSDRLAAALTYCGNISCCQRVGPVPAGVGGHRIQCGRAAQNRDSTVRSCRARDDGIARLIADDMVRATDCAAVTDCRNGRCHDRGQTNRAACYRECVARVRRGQVDGAERNAAAVKDGQMGAGDIQRVAGSVGHLNAFAGAKICDDAVEIRERCASKIKNTGPAGWRIKCDRRMNRGGADTTSEFKGRVRDIGNVERRCRGTIDRTAERERAAAGGDRVGNVPGRADCARASEVRR